MRDQYKVLAEKYDQVLEADQEPTLRVNPDGTKEWYQNDKRHRLDGPAIEYPNGSKYWYQNGKLYRLDGPAIERPDGAKYWYQNGQFHRLDGPAIEKPDGAKYWYQNGKLHRLDGPAVEKPDGAKEWYINGIEYSEKEFDLKKRTRELLKKASDETGIEMDI